MKIGILTYINAINNGAILQAKGLNQKLKEIYPQANIEFIRYISLNMELYEIARCFKFTKRKHLFNLRRYYIFKKFIPRFLTVSDKAYVGNMNHVVDRINERYTSEDILISGSDCIWRLSRSKFLPSFPNIYWLSENLSAHKFSYAVSAYQYDKQLFQKHKRDIGKILKSYDGISVRDDDTYEMVESLSLAKIIRKVPDPAFFYSITKTNVDRLLSARGLNLEKPIFALNTSYADERIADIISYFKAKGFQVIGLSMYNPLVDHNLGDELNPEQWAEVFKYVNFCVTDRFHGAIFCIKNETPFIVIETKNTPKERSKKYQLLKDLKLLYCYHDIYLKQFNISEAYPKLIENWEQYMLATAEELSKQIKDGEEFLKSMAGGQDDQLS